MNGYTQASTEKVLYQVIVSGDVIISATASISPSGPVLGTVALTGTTATVLVSGVTPGVSYVLRILVRCSSGQYLQGECSIAGEE